MSQDECNGLGEVFKRAELLATPDKVITTTFLDQDSKTGGLPVNLLVTHEDARVHDLREYAERARDRPRRVEEVATLQTIDSLISWTRRFSGPDTAIFCDLEEQTLIAVIDYHGASVPEHEDTETLAVPPTPAWKRHVGLYKFAVSPSFIAWSALKGKKLGQSEFAQFLHERELDIVAAPPNWDDVGSPQLDMLCNLLNIRNDLGRIGAPIPADPSEGGGAAPTFTRGQFEKLSAIRFARPDQVSLMANALEVRTDTRVKSAINPNTGERSLVWDESHETSARGAKTTVPNWFLLGIKALQGGALRILPVRISYAVAGGSVTFSVAVSSMEEVLRLEMEAAAQRVAAETKCPVYFGRCVRS